MAYPLIRLIFDRRKTASNTRDGSVEIVVSYERKRCWFGTGVRVIARCWNAKSCSVVRREDSDALNEQIARRLSDVRAKTEALWRDGRFTLENLKSAVKNQRIDMPPLDWFERRIQSRPLSEGTRKQHIVALKLWRSCGLFQSWGDFTLTNIEKYDALLRSKVSRATLYNYHKRLKVYINDAVQHGYLTASPYALFKVHRVDDVSTIKYLTADEVERLRSVQLDGPLDRVRDCWLFCFYTGISFAELEGLKPDDLIHEGDAVYYEKKRKKTGVSFRVLLIDEARALLDKYGGQLPVITNQKYNYFLKIVAVAAKIDKPLTSHMARHTFATFALGHGVPRDVIAAMLGHSGLREVDRYAKRVQSDIDEQYKRISDAIKKAPE